MYSAIIADDEINICNGIADVLAKHCPNLNIKNVFYNGNDALDWLKSNHTDIIITDIRMPGASGIDIAKYIFENNINSHIIITTGYKEFEYAQKAIEYKADFLLTKPFSYKELLDKIKSIKASIDIESHNAMREDKLYLNKIPIEQRAAYLDAFDGGAVYSRYYKVSIVTNEDVREKVENQDAERKEAIAPDMAAITSDATDFYVNEMDKFDIVDQTAKDMLTALKRAERQGDVNAMKARKNIELKNINENRAEDIINNRKKQVYFLQYVRICEHIVF